MWYLADRMMIWLIFRKIRLQMFLSFNTHFPYFVDAELFHATLQLHIDFRSLRYDFLRSFHILSFEGLLC